MESVIRHVRDIAPLDRETLEHFRGEKLRENQQVKIQVLTIDDSAPLASSRAALPSWRQVFDGLTDNEIADVEASVRNYETISYLGTHPFGGASQLERTPAPLPSNNSQTPSVAAAETAKTCEFPRIFAVAFEHAAIFPGFFH